MRPRPPYILSAKTGLPGKNHNCKTLKLIKMKTTILKISMFLLLFSLMGAGCEKEDVSQSVLDGKWVLLGFGDDNTNKFMPEPDSEPKSSYVVFDNGEMVAYSVTNRTLDVKYLIKREDKLSVIPGKVTLVGSDTDWGQQFLTLIGEIFKFDLNEDTLKLYYEDQKFMKLKKETK
jgi:hypothetical protein